MSEFDYDLFVIGAGSGGIRAARIASAQHGARVGIAEEYRLGGTCQIRGCVPKKIFVYASEYGAGMAHARGYGWDFDNGRFSWPDLIAKKDAEIERLSGFSRRALTNAGVDIFEERAVLAGGHGVRLVAQDRVVTAKIILIAVGGTPYCDTGFEGHELGFTSDQAFDLPVLPDDVVVVGGGYIACEFAGIFNGLGVKTRLLYRGDTVLRGFDMDVRWSVQAELERAGIEVMTHSSLAKLERGDGGRVICTLKNGGQFDTGGVMYAIGRTPKIDGLGLDAAGIAVNDRGAIVVDGYSKTSQEHVYAVGDVTDRIQLTPVAIREGHAFADTVFGGTPRSFDHDTVASAIFTQPPAGSVGLSEEDARKRFGGPDVDVYKADFRAMRHVLTGDGQRVMMKLVVRKSDDVVLGCHMVGEGAGELIQLAGVAVKAGLTKRDWDATCAVHPTIAEEFVLMREPVKTDQISPAGV